MHQANAPSPYPWCIDEYAALARSSWIFGQGKGGFVNETRRRLLAGEPMEAVTSARANTTFATDLVQRTLEVVRQGTYGTYHLVNTGACSYYDIAIEVARLLLVQLVRTCRTRFLTTKTCKSCYDKMHRRRRQSVWLVAHVNQSHLGLRLDPRTRPCAASPRRSLASRRCGIGPMRLHITFIKTLGRNSEITCGRSV